MQVGYNQKEPISLGFSYVLAYQVYNNSWSSFNTIPTPIPLYFRPEPGFDPRINIPLSPYHRSVDRPTPSRHCLKARSPWLRLNTQPRGRKERLISLSSLSETQERSIADKSAHVSIDQPYTLQRFYITIRSAFFADRRQLG